MPTSEETDPAHQSWRVFLVDEHPIVREWFSQIIAPQFHLIICGNASKGKAALDAIIELKPDVLVTDLSSDKCSGLELIKAVVSTLENSPRILVLSAHDEKVYAERVLRAGALGYVMKAAETSVVKNALRTVLSGKPYISEAVALSIAAKWSPGSSAHDAPHIADLSDREMQIFQFLGQGYTTKQIAQELNLSPKTVQVFCGRIKKKLSLPDGRALIRAAVMWSEHESGAISFAATTYKFQSSPINKT